MTPYDFNNNKLKTLTLNLSRDCNLRCTYCFEGIDFRKSTGMMDKDTAILATELFITQLGDDNGTIIFTGGEPLLNFNVIKEIINLISEKKKDNVKFFIKTNGTLITEEICEYLVEHDVDLQISIDGHKTVHDYHRVFPNGKGSFEKVTKVINLLLERNYGHKVVLRATVTHHTVQFLEESFRYLKNHKGIRVFDIAPVMGQDGQDFVLTDDDTLMYAEHLFNIAKEEFLINSEKYNNINLKFDGICGIGVWHLSIDVNGDIYPCYRLSGIREFLVGNIFKSGLSTTIPDKLAKLYSVSSRQECSNCYAKVLCQKGCYADKLLRSHSDICDDFLKQIGEFFLIENLVKSNAHMFLPLI